MLNSCGTAVCHCAFLMWTLCLLSFLIWSRLDPASPLWCFLYQYLFVSFYIMFTPWFYHLFNLVHVLALFVHGDFDASFCQLSASDAGKCPYRESPPSAGLSLICYRVCAEGIQRQKLGNHGKHRSRNTILFSFALARSGDEGVVDCPEKANLSRAQKLSNMYRQSMIP